MTAGIRLSTALGALAVVLAIPTAAEADSTCPSRSEPRVVVRSVTVLDGRTIRVRACTGLRAKISALGREDSIKGEQVCWARSRWVRSGRTATFDCRLSLADRDRAAATGLVVYLAVWNLPYDAASNIYYPQSDDAYTVTIGPGTATTVSPDPKNR